MAFQTHEALVARPSAQDLRTGALGALVVSAGYVLLPTFRSVVMAILGEEDTAPYPRPADISQHEWWGVSGAVIFALIGVGVLLTVVATVDTTSPWGRAGTALGMIGTGGYFLSGAGSLGMYSFVAANLVHTGADEGAQVAALWAVNIATGAALTVAACCTAAWLVWLGVTGPRRGIIGRLTGILLIVLAMLIIGGFTFSFLPVQFAFIPAFVLLGIALWRRRRPMRQTSADE
ncbi:hypothetical protein JOD63_000116 [Microbacterium terrae]|uniref:DUF4386 domain-containing protein n=1 Tax=Microbacterium terrae TaxID=69369 RepID=A0A0M2GXN5_9MICO|nr:hypothetical protein [Microbacterium terrae]KJL38729.1 hypothetical protein RS81_02524 [Microbacterium terrae]MBP1076148.1 hypothetical protein [Microbacterium terrae]GLJ96968.1 hypothetical protein GCM10017594_01650 [Microbacterium terrae]